MSQRWHRFTGDDTHAFAGVLLGLASVYFSILTFFGGEHFLLRNDDAFYYFTVARNWARVGQWSFDGLTPTSGVQPLWAAILSLIAWVYGQLGGDLYAMSLVRLFLWTAALVHVLSGALLYLALRRWFLAQTRLALIALALWLFTPGWAFNQTMGLEGPVYAVVFLFILHRMARLEPARGQYLLLGLSCGVLFLARVDSVLFSGGLMVFVGIRTVRQHAWRRSLTLLGLLVTGAVVVAGLYLALNIRAHGHPLPVSGQVKLYDTLEARDRAGGWFSAETVEYVGHTTLETLGLMLFDASLSLLSYGVTQYVFHYRGVSWLAATTIVTAAVVATGLTWQAAADWRSVANWRTARRPAIRLRLSSHYNRAVAVILAADVVHFAVIALFVTDFVKYSGVGWYFVPQYVTLIVATAWGWQWFMRRCTSRLVCGVVLGVVAVNLAASAVLVLAPTPTRSHRETLRELALWGNRNLPADARIGSFNAGVAGFFSQRPVFNLDGLAASQTYFEDYYKPGRICAYLERRQIDYVLDYLPAGSNCLMLAVATGTDPAGTGVLMALPYGRAPTGGQACLVRRGDCLPD